MITLLAELAAEMGLPTHERNDDQLQREILVHVMAMQSRRNQLEDRHTILVGHRIPALEGELFEWKLAAQTWSQSAQRAKKQVDRLNIIYVAAVALLGSALIYAVVMLNMARR